jgi:hypothetical protein
MVSEAMDITPLDLTEVKQWVFRAHRVPLVDLDVELRETLRSVVIPVIETPVFYSLEESQRELDYRLRTFNMDRMPHYNRGNLCRAEAGARVFPHGYEIWVDYTGISQVDADKLPKDLKLALYKEFLQGFTSLNNQKYTDPAAFTETLKKTVADALRRFKGQKLTRPTAEQIRQAIINCGLIDKASEICTDVGPYGYSVYYFTIEVDHGLLHPKTFLRVDIG